MRKTTIGTLFVALGLVVPSASPAIDLTGTWVQKNPPACRAILPSGDVLRSKGNHTPMLISQGGGGSMQLMGQGGVPWILRGFAFAKGPNPETRAEGVAVKCNDPAPLAWKIKNARTFAANAKGVSGVMKVETLQADAGVYGTCGVTFERIDTTDPLVPDCP